MAQTSSENQGTQRVGVSRVLTKLENTIEAGDYYEAHQMYRTLYFRYTSQNKFKECLDLLYSGSCKLLEKQQETSAADLTLLLVDTLEKRGDGYPTDDIETWAMRLSDIVRRMSATTVERETIITRAIKWSGDATNNPLGYPLMHELIAPIFWVEGKIEQSRHHFMLCRNGHICGHMLVKINTTHGYTTEVDLCIVQAVLQQLCVKARKTAEDTFRTYTAKHPQIKRSKSPFQQPLLNFVHLLFSCIELGKLEAFRALCDLYRPSLARDVEFEKYLVKIGVMYFNAPPPARPSGGGLMGGMFGDLFTRLFQFDEDMPEEEAARSGRPDIGQTSELD